VDPIPVTSGAGTDIAAVNLGVGAGRAQMMFQAEMHPTALDLANIGSHAGTVDDTVDPNIPSDATHALLSVETAELRWMDTGTNPTATQGHKLQADSYFWISGRQRLLDWRMIRLTSTSATIMVTYYKYA
jgi:hypothetical protein